MTVGSGIGQQFGIAPETTYGTFVAPTKFLEINSQSLGKVKNTFQGMELASGRLLPEASRRVPTTQSGSGTFSHDVVSSGMGLLLQTLMGTTVTPVVQGATTAYLQTHTFADPIGKSLTIQAGIPESGVVRPYNFLGCKVADAEFSFDINANVDSTWTIDAKQVEEVETLAVASYVAGRRPFVGTDTSIKIGAYGSEASVAGVTKATCKITRPMYTGGYYIGAAGLKAQPILNALGSIGGTIDADYVNKADWADRFASDAQFSMVLEAKGPLIASTFYNTFRITLPACYLDSGTPAVAGPDVVKGTFNWVCLLDTATGNLPRIEYISTDSVL